MNKSVKISKVLEIIKPDYVFLRVKPNNAVRNQGTDRIARAIAALYRSMAGNFRVERQKLLRFFGREFPLPLAMSYMVPIKVAYFVYMERTKVEFFFIVPRQHSRALKEKLSDVWGAVTIDEVPTLPEFGQKTTQLQLVYQKEDALSLTADHRDNNLLASNLNTVEMLEEGDRLGILYNFIPTTQMSWRHYYRHTIEKVNKRLPVDRNKAGLGYALKIGFSFANAAVREVTEVFSGGGKPKGNDEFLEGLAERMNGFRRISENTQKKGSATILETQVVVLSESKDSARQYAAARSLAQSFDAISEDNRLLAQQMPKRINITARDVGAKRNKVGDREAQSFITIAGRELLERHKCIERVETHETQVPDDLKEGVMNIGENTYRGNKQDAYLSTDREFQQLMLVLIGPTRAGKSTLIANLSRDAVNAGECVIIFDFVEQCQLSREVSAAVGRDRTLVVECGDFKKIQGLGYNEAISKSADPFEVYDCCKKQTTQLLTLIDSINADGTRLTAKMQRYLSSAALVTFVSGGSIRDMFNCLQDHNERHRLIRAVPTLQKENMKKYIASLDELDEYNSKGTVITGTKDNLIAGIIDRLNQLEQNAYIEKMLDKGTAGNIDLTKEMQKNQVICIRMPSDMFGTESERDVYTTYWSTKIWLALQMRSKQLGGDRSKYVKVNMVVDELYQVPYTEQFMKSKLSQYAKFGLKPIVSAHYLNQIKYIRDELRSANASYMLISGCDKKNFEELKSELYPYQEEDLLKLPRYHSLNLIKNKEGYAKFITRLPKPI